MRVVVGTVVTRRALPFARVVTASVCTHHPEWTVSAVIADCDGAPSLANDGVAVLSARELETIPGEVGVLAAMYGEAERAVDGRRPAVGHLRLRRLRPEAAVVAQ